MAIAYDYVLHRDESRAWGGTRREIQRYIASLTTKAVEDLVIEVGATGVLYPAELYYHNVPSQDLHVL